MRLGQHRQPLLPGQPPQLLVAQLSQQHLAQGDAVGRHAVTRGHVLVERAQVAHGVHVDHLALAVQTQVRQSPAGQHQVLEQGPGEPGEPVGVADPPAQLEHAQPHPDPPRIRIGGGVPQGLQRAQQSVHRHQGQAGAGAHLRDGDALRLSADRFEHREGALDDPDGVGGARLRFPSCGHGFPRHGSTVPSHERTTGRLRRTARPAPNSPGGASHRCLSPRGATGRTARP